MICVWSWEFRINPAPTGELLARSFLNVSKMKRKPANVLRKTIRKQINYLKRDIRIINKMLDAIKVEPIPFDRWQLKYFLSSSICWNNRRPCTGKRHIKWRIASWTFISHMYVQSCVARPRQKQSSGRRSTSACWMTMPGWTRYILSRRTGGSATPGSRRWAESR